MDNQSKSEVVYFGLEIIQVAFLISLFGLIYSHRWLAEFDGPASDIMLFVSDSAEAEYELMQDVRLVSGLVAAATFAGVVFLSEEYESYLDNPIRENKKAFAYSIIGTGIGAAGFLYTSDLFLESIALTIAVIGVIGSVWSMGYHVLSDNSNQSNRNKSP